ncbi:MAG TPA: cytochrome-c peroxidase, partial [Planctomycetaceae bacterium]|nr:cytochrome-c peroxidase [Planctomycetaceae bacterium]
MTRAKVELGRQLYFDKRLSRDNTISCATCHDPEMGWTEDEPVSTGIKGQKGTRNSPTVLNRIFGKTQFWDGRAESLEEQALGPIENPVEMGFKLDELVQRLKDIEGYRIQFEKVFGEVSADAIAKAIAAFERTVMVGEAPYDYYQQALPYLKMSKEELAKAGPEAKKAVEEYQKHKMSDSAKRGMDLFFGKALCSVCHLGPDFTDEGFHNLGVGMTAKEPDPGRKKVTGKEEDMGA